VPNLLAIEVVFLVGLGALVYLFFAGWYGASPKAVGFAKFLFGVAARTVILSIVLAFLVSRGRFKASP
jgi:hypothetical protein